MTAAVEAGIHKAVCDLAQRIFDQHGVQLCSVSVEWLDISTIADLKTKVASVHMETKTLAGRNEKVKG